MLPTRYNSSPSYFTLNVAVPFPFNVAPKALISNELFGAPPVSPAGGAAPATRGGVEYPPRLFRSSF